MRNISWCPCLNTRLNFYLRINYAAYFTVCHLMDYINPGNCVVHNKVTAILHGFAALISLAIAAANWRCR